MDEKIRVAAVCGNEVRIFGPKFGNEPRSLVKVLVFPHRGAALEYAQEFEDAERGKGR